MYSFDYRAEDFEVVQGELDVKREDELHDSPWSEPSQGISSEHPTTLDLPARIDLFDVPALLSTSQGDADLQRYTKYRCNTGLEVHPDRDGDDGFPSPLHPLRAPFLAVELDFMRGITGSLAAPISGVDGDSDISTKLEELDLDLAAAGVKRQHEDDDDIFVPVKSEENDAPMSRESLGPSPGAWTRAQGRASQQKRLRFTVEKDTYVPVRVVADAIHHHLERQETRCEAANQETLPATAPTTPRAHLPTPPPERHPHSRATVTKSSPKLESDGLRHPRTTCRGRRPPRYHIWKRYD